MRKILLFLGVFCLSLSTVTAQESDLDDHLTTMTNVLQSLIAGDPDLDLLENIANSDDPLYIAPLIDLLYFTRTPNFQETNTVIFDALATLSGEELELTWRAYFEWASANDVSLPPEYDTWKGRLLSIAVDPNFAQFFDDVQDTATINMVEVVFGGVPVDGIPSLVNPRHITPEQAALEGEAFSRFCNGDNCGYPVQDELVFGVEINGDARAYPLRILNWHEMFNDVIGSVDLHDTPNGDVLCQFRAPTVFTVLEFDADWVRINGESAGCPEDGWLRNNDELIFNVEAPQEQLTNGEEVLGRVQGTPVMLSYCTLCGAGVLYNPVVDLVVDGVNLGEQQLEFGSSGLLMRSNKLMYDRNTNTIWNALTGVPAFGPLVESGIQLERLPVVVTDWASWLNDHPDTSVLSLATGFQRNYTNGAAYSDYFNDPNFIMFPVWQQDTSENENKEIVFALLLDETPKAYPLEGLIPEVVINDTLAEQALTIVAYPTPNREFFEPGGAVVRAYATDGRIFRAGEARNTVIDDNDTVWRVRESGLVAEDSGETFERIPGHLAFWFGWYGFYPETLVYTTE